MEKEWSGKTQGGTFGQKSVLFYFKFGSLRLVYLFLYLVIPFYLIFDRKGYRAIHWYSKNCIDQNRKFHLPFIFRLYHNFGQVFIDRFAVFGNKKNRFKFILEHKELFESYLTQENGFIITSAHVGNFELLSYSIEKTPKTIHPILYGGEAEVFQKLRTDLFKEKNISPIILNEDGSFIFEINAALQKGGIVSMPADRTVGKSKEFTTDFLGHEATFPLGVFQIAATLEVPVLTIFVVKEKFKTYKVYIDELVIDRDTHNKVERANALGKEYVSNLEKILRNYPSQWYNFYMFWNSNK